MSDDEEVETRTKDFANGDSYNGGWKHEGPERYGKYTWKDGSWYEGGWKNGLRHGVGKHVWPSGSIYQGEWRNNCMHGVGTFDAPNTSRYQGSWFNDAKHGLGRMLYASGDVYEGLWKSGKPDGPGRYVWADRNEYDGEWKNGLMHGQGTLVWHTGDRYDGEWKEGQHDGLGIFTLPDGTLYNGLWKRGQQHGVCLFHPSHHAPRGTPSNLSLASMSVHPVGAGAALDHDDPEHLKPKLSYRGSLFTHGTERSAHVSARRAYVQVFDAGRLLRETALPLEEVDAVMATLKRSHKRHVPHRLRLLKEGKLQARIGEAIYQGHSSYSLMVNLQHGIRYSVGKITPEPAPKELSPADFELKVKQPFPHCGSEMTPVHRNDDFTWKDFAPMVFRKLRELFGINAGDYMLSLCSDAALRQLNTPGKSGAVFFLSHDDAYFVKTLRPGETKLLFKMLPQYYHHVCAYPHTLLTKFFGLHQIKLMSGRKVDFVVMSNLFNSSVQLHKKFDLKGSKVGRTAGKVNSNDSMVIYKDLDMDISFKLDHRWHDRLMYQLKADSALLEACQIMDYSLLLGIHYRSRASLHIDQHSRPVNFGEVNGEQEFQSEYAHMADKVHKMKVLEPARTDLLQLIQQHLRGAHKQNRSSAIARMDEVTNMAIQLGQSRVQLGVNMPARTIPKATSDSLQEEDVVLYFGIIDILQDFNLPKRLEHRLKSIVHDSGSISVTHPKAYAQRFNAALKQVFI